MASEYATLKAIQAHGDLNPVQATRLKELEASGQTGGGKGSFDSILNNAISFLSGLFPKAKTPYEQVNPFSFDEALAKQASTAEYSPYYDEMLSDYTTQVQRTVGRSEEDKKRTLDYLAGGKDYYMGAERRALDQATRQTNEGYAGNGLFFSGAKQRDLNTLQETYGADTGEYQRQYQYNTGTANLTAQRTKENADLALSMYNRDVGRAKQTAIEEGVLQRKSEALQQYETGRQAYYANPAYG